MPWRGERVETEVNAVLTAVSTKRAAAKAPWIIAVFTLDAPFLEGKVTIGERVNDLVGLEVDEAEPISKDNLTVPGFGREEKPSHFYRKGQIGDWQNYFTEDQKRWFKETAGEALVKHGYEKDLNW